MQRRSRSRPPTSLIPTLAGAQGPLHHPFHCARLLRSFSESGSVLYTRQVSLFLVHSTLFAARVDHGVYGAINIVPQDTCAILITRLDPSFICAGPLNEETASVSSYLAVLLNRVEVKTPPRWTCNKDQLRSTSRSAHTLQNASDLFSAHWFTRNAKLTCTFHS